MDAATASTSPRFCSLTKHRWMMLGAVALFMGCGSDSRTPAFPIYVSDPNRVSSALLLSEVENAVDPAKLLNTDFVLENRSQSSQTIALAGKSCSCYGVMLDGVPLEVNTPFTVAADESRILSFDVAPPDQPAENSWSVRLVSRETHEQEMTLTLTVRVHADVRLEPDALIVSVPSESDQDPASAEQYDLAIHRTWRAGDGESSAPTLAGLPTGWQFADAIVGEAPSQIDGELWRQTWLTSVQRRAGVTSPVEEVPHETLGSEEIRLKPVPQGAVKGQAELRHRDLEPGHHRMEVTFKNQDGDEVGAFGRFVVRKPPGITAPSVVHWGNVSVGETRSRRIMLTASDDRAFAVLRVHQDQPSNDEGLGDPSLAETAGLSDEQTTQRAWTFQSSTSDIVVSLDSAVALTNQSLHLDLRPHHAGTIDETLVLNTDHPLTSQIELRLKAIVTPKKAGAAHSGP